MEKIYGRKKYDLIKFSDGDFSLDVNVSPSEDTVWLTQDEMAMLFEVDRTRIVRHINNIYRDKELEFDSTCAENAQVQNEKNRKVTRTVNMYNLDMIISLGYRINNIFKEELDEISNSQKMRLTENDKPTIYYSLNVIISVGYRVKSTRGVRFRQWANQVSKQYLLNGYSINKGRCIVCQNSISELNNEIKQIESRINNVLSEELCGFIVSRKFGKTELSSIITKPTT